VEIIEGEKGGRNESVADLNGSNVIISDTQSSLAAPFLLTQLWPVNLSQHPIDMIDLYEEKDVTVSNRYLPTRDLWRGTSPKRGIFHLSTRFEIRTSQDSGISALTLTERETSESQRGKPTFLSEVELKCRQRRNIDA
jgi:hypothetical protein